MGVSVIQGVAHAIQYQEAVAGTDRLFHPGLLCVLIICFFFVCSGESAAEAISPEPTSSEMPWWAWPLILFVVTFFLGIVAVLGGVGGGVLYVPIVGGFLPFHLDFVRGAGLLVALAGALAAGPGYCAREWPISVLPCRLRSLLQHPPLPEPLLVWRSDRCGPDCAGWVHPRHCCDHVDGEEIGIPRGERG